jgi:hypothetical protein
MTRLALLNPAGKVADRCCRAKGGAGGGVLESRATRIVPSAQNWLCIQRSEVRSDLTSTRRTLKAPPRRAATDLRDDTLHVLSGREEQRTIVTVASECESSQLEERGLTLVMSRPVE